MSIKWTETLLSRVKILDPSGHVTRIPTSLRGYESRGHPRTTTSRGNEVIVFWDVSLKLKDLSRNLYSLKYILTILFTFPYEPLHVAKLR